MASVLGWIATILFSACYFPQIWKMVALRQVTGVSVAFFAMQFLANVIALIYATMIKQPPLQFKYVTGLVLSLVTVYYYFRYSR